MVAAATAVEMLDKIAEHQDYVLYREGSEADCKLTSRVKHWFRFENVACHLDYLDMSSLFPGYTTHWCLIFSFTWNPSHVDMSYMSAGSKVNSNAHSQLTKKEDWMRDIFKDYGLEVIQQLKFCNKGRSGGDNLRWIKIRLTDDIATCFIQNSKIVNLNCMPTSFTADSLEMSVSTASLSGGIIRYDYQLITCDIRAVALDSTAIALDSTALNSSAIESNSTTVESDTQARLPPPPYTQARLSSPYTQTSLPTLLPPPPYTEIEQ